MDRDRIVVGFLLIVQFVSSYYQIENIPTKGYIHTTKRESLQSTKSSSLYFKINEKINRVPFCENIEFVNLPRPNPSPLMGSTEFKVVYDEGLIHDRLVYNNGHEYLSFIPSKDNDMEGNWLIGVEPGIDSGYVYLSTKEYSISPFQMDNDLGFTWQWLMNQQWKSQPGLKIICKDKIKQPSIYYRVEYYDEASGDYINTLLVPNVSTLSNSNNPVPQTVESAVYLDVKLMQWVEVYNIQLFARFGGSHLIIDTVNPKTADYIGILVNEELGNSGCWRLTFLRNPELGHAWDEISIQLHGSRGIQDSTVTLSMDQSINTDQLSIKNMKPGQYLWTWYENQPSSTNNITHQMVDEILLYCVAISNQKALFRYYASNRVDTMRQNLVTKHTDFVTIYFSPSTTASMAQSIIQRVEYQGEAIQLFSKIVIQANVVDYILDYLKNKDGKPNNMSSCYLYHAAVSLPRPFVYAAEILCVLIGSKPVTLIQYTTASDHQWKFPLVSELAQAISSAKVLHGNTFPFQFKIFRYYNDETLVIYRESREYLTLTLQPFNQSQALHPAPYPDKDNLTRDWELQIYYAYWNGYVLGYPDYFIQSYCETFHNGLELSEKLVQIEKAKREVREYFERNGLKAITIKSGLNPSISTEHLKHIKDTLTVV